jgi:hypothetical protein
MEWMQAYPQSNQPTAEQISDYIANPLWENLNGFLKFSYQVEPTYAYSGCSGQPGWNVKYQKAGRSLCTLYPMPGFFIALVVIGNKEQTEAELLLPTFSEHVQDLYGTAASVMGGRWLMIHVTDEHVLEDVKRLIQIRRKV